MAQDPIMIGAAIAGLIIALLLRGILPYLLKRKEAEENGLPIPNFATSYMTTFIIAIITGVMGVMVSIEELENRLVGVASIMTAAAIGFTFTFSTLELSNRFVDLKTDQIVLNAFRNKFSSSQQKGQQRQQQQEGGQEKAPFPPP